MGLLFPEVLVILFAELESGEGVDLGVSTTIVGNEVVTADFTTDLGDATEVGEGETVVLFPEGG